MPLATHAFIDLQVNGFAGIDFNDPTITATQYQQAIPAIWACGVTRFFPTIVTGSSTTMRTCLAVAAQFGASAPGIHLEGPWISPEDGPRGAHPREHVRPIDRNEFLTFQENALGRIKLVTLAPELPGAIGFIEWLRSQGIVVSLGHTAATAQQIADAVGAGARLSTHLGNGCADMLHRHQNPIWPQLAHDSLTASFIADGIHLPPASIKAMIRAKGVSRSILVTDASSPAGCTPGDGSLYTFGDAKIELTSSGRVQLAGTARLAGSALRMNDAVANVVRDAGVSWDEAFRMAGERPAALLGMSFPNDRVIAEIVGGRLEIQETILEGKTVWRKTS